jgi:hypothetical protein
MKNILFAFIAITSILFNTNKTYSQSKSAITNIADSGTISLAIENIDIVTSYANSITQDDLKTLVYKLASDEFEGRRTGENGQKIAAQYLVEFYKNNGIVGANKDSSYLQIIPQTYFRGRSKNNSENVVAFIKGSEKPDEYVVISAHYDHEGIEGEKIYNGADDDASGTSAVLEIAQAFQDAVKAGNGPKRSIIFLNVTGEEEGLFGSKFYTEFPIFPLKNTVANLNIDMIGRVDERHMEDDNYVYLIGADKISTELHDLSEVVNKKYTKLTIDYTYNDENDPNRFYYRSDHYNFAKNGIPVIFYFNGVHEDYHKHTDTADKIRYDLLEKRTQLIFYTAWEIANREERLAIDKK